MNTIRGWLFCGALSLALCGHGWAQGEVLDIPPPPWLIELYEEGVTGITRFPDSYAEDLLFLYMTSTTRDTLAGTQDERLGLDPSPCASGYIGGYMMGGLEEFNAFKSRLTEAGFQEIESAPSDNLRTGQVFRYSNEGQKLIGEWLAPYEGQPAALMLCEEADEELWRERKAVSEPSYPEQSQILESLQGSVEVAQYHNMPATPQGILMVGQPFSEYAWAIGTTDAATEYASQKYREEASEECAWEAEYFEQEDTELEDGSHCPMDNEGNLLPFTVTLGRGMLQDGNLTLDLAPVPSYLLSDVDKFPLYLLGGEGVLSFRAGEGGVLPSNIWQGYEAMRPSVNISEPDAKFYLQQLPLFTVSPQTVQKYDLESEALLWKGEGAEELMGVLTPQRFAYLIYFDRPVNISVNFTNADYAGETRHATADLHFEKGWSAVGRSWDLVKPYEWANGTLRLLHVGDEATESWSWASSEGRY